MKKNNFIIAGPCVLETYEKAEEIYLFSSEIAKKYGFDYIFKASFDKANRTSIYSDRGVGIEKGKQIFKKLKEKYNCKITTDVHESHQVKEISKVVDILQIPAFLCRQTDLLISAGKTNKIVNIKKGQFASIKHMEEAVKKVKSVSNNLVFCTERGTFFGYSDLVVDFRNIKEMSRICDSTIIDFTHSCQKYSGGSTTDGNNSYSKPIAVSGKIWGCKGFFGEVHMNPKSSPSDKNTILNFSQFEDVIKSISEAKCLI